MKNIALIIFALLFGTAAFAQKTKYKNVSISELLLPELRLPSDINTYTVVVKENGFRLTDYDQSIESIKVGINTLNRYKYVEKKADMTVVLDFYGERLSTSLPSQNGREPIQFPVQLSLVDGAGKRFYQKFVIRIDLQDMVNEQGAHISKNDMIAYLIELAIKNTNFYLAKLLDGQPRELYRNPTYLSIKKSSPEEQAQFDKAIDDFRAAVKNKIISAQVLEAAVPATNFWEAGLTKYDPKKQAAQYFACAYNLFHIALLKYDIERAESLAEELKNIDNPYNRGVDKWVKNRRNAHQKYTEKEVLIIQNFEEGRFEGTPETHKFMPNGKIKFKAGTKVVDGYFYFETMDKIGDVIIHQKSVFDQDIIRLSEIHGGKINDTKFFIVTNQLTGPEPYTTLEKGTHYRLTRKLVGGPI